MNNRIRVTVDRQVEVTSLIAVITKGREREGKIQIERTNKEERRRKEKRNVKRKRRGEKEERNQRRKRLMSEESKKIQPWQTPMEHEVLWT